MKKWILLILTAVCVVFCALGLAACAPKNLQAHTWSEDWARDKEEHWRYCTVDGCKLKKDKAAHEWEISDDQSGLPAPFRAPACNRTGYGREICKVCKQAIIHNIAATGEHDAELVTATYRAATCGVDGYAEYECKDCHNIETKVIPATGEHVYTNQKFAVTADKQGHQPVCDVCGHKGETSPHSESVKNRIPATGKNDGKVEYECADCHNIRTENIVNRNVPNKLDVVISREGKTLEMKDYQTGKEVQMTADGTSGEYIYDLVFTATYPDGTTETANALTVEDSGDGGVRAYYQDNNGYETWIATGGNNDFTFGGEDLSRPQFRAYNTGSFWIIFRYETGDKYKEENRVRAELELHIVSVPVSAASASVLSVSGIDDGITCLATGAYECKSY